MEVPINATRKKDIQKILWRKITNSYNTYEAEVWTNKI